MAKLAKGLRVTFSDFWLVWLTVQGERYPYISCYRTNEATPIDHQEAKDWWYRRCFGAEFSDDAAEYVQHLINKQPIAI